MTIQRDFQISPGSAPPKILALSIHVQGVDPAKVDRLEAKLNEYKQELANDSDCEGLRIEVTRR